MAKKEDNPKTGKYSEKEFSKARRKVIFSAARWGAAGYLAGKGYEASKDLYKKHIQPMVDTSEKGLGLLEKGVKAIGREFNHTKREAKILIHGEKAVEEEENRQWDEERKRLVEQRNQKQQENIGRRGFLESVGRGALNIVKSYAGLVHNYPVPTLTITGTAYGAVKRTITLRPEYLTKRDIAVLKDNAGELRDENTRLKEQSRDYETRIKVLEEYNKKLGEKLKDYDSKFDSLDEKERREREEIQEELNNLSDILDSAGRKSGALETIVEEPRKGVVPIIAAGLAGIILSLFVGTSKMTGFAVLPDTALTVWNISLILFIVSLILIYVGIKKKRIKIVKRNSFKFE